jgi:hypothetical protein
LPSGQTQARIGVGNQFDRKFAIGAVVFNEMERRSRQLADPLFEFSASIFRPGRSLDSANQASAPSSLVAFATMSRPFLPAQ